MHVAPSSFAALPLLLAATLAVPAGAGGDAVELEVLGVVQLESEPASLLLLRQKGASTVLPLFVGQAEGAAIDQRLKPRPGLPARGGRELAEEAIAALGGKVTRVDIEGHQPAPLMARVTLQQGDRRVRLEARPSDSVALAIAAHAPIFTSAAVMSEAGLTERDLARMDANRRKSDEESPGRAVQSF